MTIAAPTPPFRSRETSSTRESPTDAHGLGRPVRGGVVDDEDPVDELGDPGQRRPDQPLLVVGGDDDRDALPVDHRL